MKARQAKDKAKKVEKHETADQETSQPSEMARPTPEQVFEELTRLAAHLCNVPLASVNLIDACRQWFGSGIEVAYAEPPQDFTLCAYALLRRDLLIVPDTLLDERFATSTLATVEPPIRFCAAMPLITHKGQALGALCVMDYVPRELSLEQLESLRTLGHKVMTQLEFIRSLAGKERTSGKQTQT
jgi:two-component system, OmpR family, sensor histidine kinase VicK